MGKSKDVLAARMRWNSQHGGRGRQRRRGYPGKVCRPSRWQARVHLTRLVVRDLLKRRYRRIRSLSTYPCRWGATYKDGETAPLHWHVGHSRPRGPRSPSSGGIYRGPLPTPSADEPAPPTS